MNIKPIGERVLIKHAKQEEKTKEAYIFLKQLKKKKKKEKLSQLGSTKMEKSCL